MKKFYTLSTGLLLSLAMFASNGGNAIKVTSSSGSTIDARDKSSLTIKSTAQEFIKVMVDGKWFEPSASSVVIENVNSGFHEIQIYRERSRMFMRKFELVYNSKLDIGRKTNLLITVDRSGRVATQETKIIDRGRDDYNDRDRNDQGERWDNYDSHEGYASGMSDREFTRVLQSIQKEWLESNKIISAKQIVRNSKMSSAQVKQMVLLFSFESNKLELAKLAYDSTVDKRNYDMVFDALSFNSSKKELSQYIGRR